MPPQKLTKLELQILEALWAHGKASIREIQEAFPEPRPAYTTIQTTVYRLEGKKAVRRVRKISNAHIFEPTVARDVARHKLLDEILSFFGGRAQPMMAQLAEAGKLTLDDVRELEKTIKNLEKNREDSQMTNHLWQSTIFAVAAGLLTLAFRKNRAQVRYWLWLSASLKFLIPFSLLMSLGSYLEWTPVANTVATQAVTSVMKQMTQPFPETVSFAAPKTPGTDWMPVAVLSVWVCGFAAIALIRFRDWLRIRAAVRSSSSSEIISPVEVRSSPGLLEPGVVGFLRPILLLPEGIERYLTPHQLEAVLAHELCHVRRRDNLTSAIHMVVEATFWFHPLVWWIGARLVEERERACDEAVLSLGGEPQVYAEAIVAVCKLYVESPLVCVSGVTGSDNKKRIEAIMSNRALLQLNFGKKAALAAAAITAMALPVVVGVMHAQSPAAATSKFEVASIKPCQPRQEPGHLSMTGENSSPGRLSTGCSPLLGADDGIGLIPDAYVSFADGHLDRENTSVPINGGPSWLRSAFYEIDAKAEGNPSVEMMMGPMLQALLEDRFQLKIHRQTSEGPVYFLTVTRGGPKLHSSAEGSCTHFSTFPPPPLQPGQAFCRVMISVRSPASVEAQGATLDELSKLLRPVLDRPVINKTGITGRFDIRVEFSREGTKLAGMPVMRPNDGRPPASDSTGPPSIFTALQEQLGLRLESAKGPVEVMIIDHVERPSAN